MASRPYVLLIVTGTSPQVVTETVWWMARSQAPPRQPARVEVLTTGVGAAFVRAQLLGEEVHQPDTGQPVEGAAPRWAAFCEDLFGRTIPLEIVDVPREGLRQLNDIRTPADDARFADLCYDTVARLTGPDALPLVGSIAGGRKTMSAHLMTAFSVYARPEDRLVHVLVNPSHFERDRDFFYPTAETAGEVQIDLVDVRFPRLHALLASDLIDALPADRRDLKSILDALEPYMVAVRRPARVRLHLGHSEAFLRLLDQHGDAMADVRLPHAEAATFATLAEHLADGGAVAADTLYASPGAGAEARRHPTFRLRRSVARACYAPNEERWTPWTTSDDVSKAISHLNARLREHPALAKYLTIEREPPRTGPYTWSGPWPPVIEVASEDRVDPKAWWFEHLPRPTVAAEDA